LRFKQTVKGITIVIPIRKPEDGSAYDLTGKTITLYMKNRSTGATISLSGTPQGNPTAGNAQFTVGATDFATIGNYDMEIEITQGGTLLEKTETYGLAIEQPVH